jgi:hypothetical protein
MKQKEHQLEQPTEQKPMTVIMESEKWADAALESMMSDQEIGIHIKNNEPLQGLMKGFFLMGVDIAKGECQNAVIDAVQSEVGPTIAVHKEAREMATALGKLAIEKIKNVGSKNIATVKKEKSSGLIF